MGWWTTEKSGKELVQGDMPYDIMGEAFQQIAQEYEQDWDRKPTLDEIIHIIETVLAAGIDNYLSEGEETEIVSLMVKTKRRRKYQPFRVGDFFVVPLKGELHAFGRILSDHRLDDVGGMLVGIYDKISTQILTPMQLKGEPFIFPPFYCDDEGWKTWKWKIIGNMPVGPDEFEYPKHKEGFEGLGWWIRHGDRVYEATEKEVRDLEYASLWSTGAVEKRIMEYLNKAAGSSVKKS